MEAKTGKLRWHYQFTPHDLHDWDATEPFVLVDTMYRGRQRKLLLQANRNGFVYVLDRTTGEFLLGKPFVKKMNWASGIGADGVPQLLPANEPTKAGVKTCPSVRGATNWYSTAFHPETKLFYVMAVEDCSIYTKSQRGGYEGYRVPSDSGLKFLRALNIETGEVAWEIPQVGPQEANYSGVLTTAGGLLFYGETGGRFAAVDVETGKTLYTFKASESWRASPMTYMVKGRRTSRSPPAPTSYPSRSATSNSWFRAYSTASRGLDRIGVPFAWTEPNTRAIDACASTTISTLVISFSKLRQRSHRDGPASRRSPLRTRLRTDTARSRCSSPRAAPLPPTTPA